MDFPADLAGRMDEYQVVLQRILYVSRAAPGIGLAEVYAIIRAAHAANPGRGLSGALIFLDGWFAQVLEGPAPAVAATFARIARDPRHAGLELRLNAPALGRLFPGQAMALRYRACLGGELLDALGTRAGFPVTDLPADVLTQFLIDACHQKAILGALRA